MNIEQVIIRIKNNYKQADEELRRKLKEDLLRLSIDIRNERPTTTVITDE